ncbi:Sel1 repeat-containing protein [Rhodothalassium salexigens DSM 2132]|uniref:Sel1 repeat-containing protein n=2 Tax=Rhodothalassium salexigens TaxID=1086 RepID=A0A4R2PM30_RHOSA|nr:Sel1 repeat-containing protein [Rhodothalassium salexigens DSM 2132]
MIGPALAVLLVTAAASGADEQRTDPAPRALERGSVAATVLADGPADLPAPRAAGVAERLARGVALFRAGDAAAAVAIWRPLAEAGDPGAQLNLAQAYRLGRGVPRDDAQALTLARQSAGQGHPKGQALYAQLLAGRSGGGSVAAREAVGWWRLAAERGVGPAQMALAEALWDGRGAARDRSAALAWMHLAAAGRAPGAAARVETMTARLGPAEARAAQARLTAWLAAGRVAAPPTGPVAGSGTASDPGSDMAPGMVASGMASGPDAEPALALRRVEPRAAAAPGASGSTVSEPGAASPGDDRPAPSRRAARAAEQRARPGAWGVQLGAMSDGGRARAQADALTDRHGDLLAGRTVTVASADSAGAALYRLRVFGFDDEAAARAACAGFRRAGQGCYVVAPEPVSGAVP